MYYIFSLFFRDLRGSFDAQANGELLTVNTVNKVARFSNKEAGDDSWNSKLTVKIGAVLIELLCKVARVPPNLT